MTPNGLLQIFFFFAVLLALTKPMGAYMARVFEGEKTLLDSRPSNPSKSSSTSFSA